MAEILLNTLTEGNTSPSGTGAFDLLMQAFKSHLEQEHTARRIIGAEYAQVYLGGMQSCMQNAVTFMLGAQVNGAQADVATAQGALLTQKLETERAQTEDRVIAGDVAGVLGKQNELLTAQVEGFARDAEQKLFKIYADSYAVRRSTSSTEPAPTGLDNLDISAVSAKAAEGIGVSIVTGA